MDPKTPIRTVMTPMPHTVGVAQPLAVAHRLLAEHHVRHLPVLDGGRLVGIVSDRDLRLVESIRGVDLEQVPVEEAMTPEPYSVGLDTPIQDVVATMAAHKYGSVVVMDGHNVAGIFTTHDMARVLSNILHRTV